MEESKTETEIGIGSGCDSGNTMGSMLETGALELRNTLVDKLHYGIVDKLHSLGGHLTQDANRTGKIPITIYLQPRQYIEHISALIYSSKTRITNTSSKSKTILKPFYSNE